MKKMIAVCGLDCAQCDAYLATVNNDQALREKTARLWSELNQTAITPEQINCEGCLSSGVRTVYCESLCAVRQCAARRGKAHCGLCAEMERCGVLGRIAANAPEALDNLREKAGRKTDEPQGEQ